MDEARVKAAFLAALESPTPAETLRQVCAGDAAMRERVERLLRAREAAALNATPGAAAAAPESIGPYRVLRRLGAGGMGVVYECEQDRPRRRVAVKVLHPWLVSPEGRRRLEREAELLTLLRHPGIAQVYAAGDLDATVPYLVMELIPGASSITRHAREHGLSRAARLALVADACDAVHAAHLAGVIHRDIKPANLLVDERGRIRVIDFGVGRLTGADDASLLTQAGQIVGTLHYMSPEQAGGSPPDVRADVYALGAVLHELLCGRTPFDLDGLSLAAAASRVASGVDPRSPGLARLPRDVRAVTLRALSPRAADRYQSAAFLAEDLRHVLAGRAVHARPPGPVRRLLAAAACHPILGTVTVCLLLAAVIIAGTAAGVYILALRPDSVAVSSSRQAVTLTSRGNQTLAQWDTGPRGQVLFARMTGRAPEFGGGRLVLIGMDHNSVGPALPGEVSAFLPEAPGVALWSTARYPPLPPQNPHARSQFTTALDLAMLADVLPEVPGQELVCVHSLYPYSASAVRVFDLAGTLRYEVWHDGAIRSVEWLAGPGLLVLAGVNSERRWEERGYPLGGGNRSPIVVFALSPRDGHTNHGTWIVGPGTPRDATVRWYRWLGPPESLTGFEDMYATLEPAARVADRSAKVLLNVVSRPASGPRGGFVFLLGPEGRAEDRWADDGYKSQRTAGLAPPIDRFGLFDYEELPAVPSQK